MSLILSPKSFAGSAERSQSNVHSADGAGGRWVSVSSIAKGAEKRGILLSALRHRRRCIFLMLSATPSSASSSGCSAERGSKMYVCPNCTCRDIVKRFCYHCGTKLVKEQPNPERFCHWCKMTLKDGERFCRRCGKSRQEATHTSPSSIREHIKYFFIRLFSF